MLPKYLLNSIKSDPIWHFIIILCETVLLLIVFCANGILLDALNRNSGSGLSKSMVVYVDKPLITSQPDNKEKIDAFLSSVPNMDSALFDLTIESVGTPGILVYAFKDYEAMISYWTNERGVRKDVLPTREQYGNGEKTVLVGALGIGGKYEYQDERHIFLGSDNDAYEILGTVPSSKGIFVNYGAEPAGSLESILVRFKYVPDAQQVDEMEKKAEEIFGANTKQIRLPVLQGLLDLRANTANIVLTAIMLLLVVFNTALIYRQAAEKNKKRFAVFAFCGFPKKTAVSYSLAEMLLLSAASGVLSLVVFELWVKGIMSRFYGSFSAMFTPGYYVVLILSFIAISVLMFAACVAPTLKKTVICQLSEI